MEYLAGEAFLQALPLLLAGPILRRTEPDTVTVWIACKRACQVTLQVYETAASGHQLANVVLTGTQATVALGKNLHLLTVTADQIQGQPLSCDRIYAYDLTFATGHQTYSLQAALQSDQRSTPTVSYFAHQYPTFVLPPETLNDLRLVHGSCRKPHGQGYDTLPILDCLLAAAADHPRRRPQQLLLTGDQIYGDDVADPLLWMATTLGNTLLGWDEKLPVSQANPTVIHTYTAQELPAGKRAQLATRHGGFTAGLDDKREKVNSHLLSLGEYLASYLMANSPACWPSQFPEGKTMTHGSQAIRRWNQDRQAMQQFGYTLWKVRRALANVPTYTIFDDHDVSDDWNLNQAWCLRVLGRPLGRRTVYNAMLTYALCQAWGNTPEQFKPGQPGAKLLAAVQRWSASAGQDEAAAAAIATYLGLPPIHPMTHLPQFQPDGILSHSPTLVLKRTSEALTWHYTIRSTCHEIIVLDTRTWRGYPDAANPLAPPSLLSPTAFKQQISQPLQEDSNFASDSHRATFMVAPTNVFGLKVLDWIHAWQLKHHKVFSADVGDAWNMNAPALATLLTRLFEQRQTVFILSGDIHHSAVIKLSHQNLKTGQTSTILQLTSSAMKNEELLTRLLHTRLKQWLLPERPRHWIGWLNPPHMVESPIHSQSMPSPDWRCCLEWLPRQKSQSPNFDPDLSWLVPSRQARSNRWQRLKFWQTRWLQEGNEVVGVNNLAQIQFMPTPTEKELTLVQDHYWYSPWTPIEIVYSRFEHKLAPVRLDNARPTTKNQPGNCGVQNLRPPKRP